MTLLQLICNKIGYCIMARFSEVKKILKNHQLRITDGRVDILAFFLRQEKALSFKDLEEEFQGYDRVTLYRTLNSFTEQGVLHKIPSDSGFATYGLSHNTCDSGEHHHDHIHFKCESCGTTECLDQHVPTVVVPGYQIKDANLILNGICKSCA